MLDLSTLGKAKTDNSSNFTSINERDVVQPISLGYQSHHAQFVVFEPVIDPDKSFVPNEPLGQGERQAMDGSIQLVFGWIEFNAHYLM